MRPDLTEFDDDIETADRRIAQVHATGGRIGA